jgi:gliding motility-associated-like protein
MRFNLAASYCLLLLLVLCGNLKSSAQVCNYSQIPTNLISGLVAYYPFCGNANDISGNNYNGAIVGSSVPFVNDRFNISSSAAQLGSGAITANSSVFNFARTATFTVSFWFTKETTANGGRLISTECPEGNFRVAAYNNGNYAVQYGDYISDVVTLNEWTHLSYTYNNRVEKVYINGVLKYTNYDASTEALNFCNPFTIGAKASNTSADRWVGKIDDLVVHNRALSDCEVTQLFTATASAIPALYPPNTVSTASSTPTLCINNALTNITHTTTGATGIGTASGLPAGVTAAWSTNTITISGTPTQAGTFTYTIPLTGGCGTVNATGTITVTAAPNAGTLSGTQQVCLTDSWTLESTTTRSMTAGWAITLQSTDPNKVYKIEVSGRWGIALNSLHRDAAYDCGSGNTIGVTGTPLANRGCDANWSLNGSCPPPVPNLPAGYSASNTYTYLLWNGTTGGTAVSFSDGNYGDNSGSLTFKLYSMPATNAATYSSTISGGTWSSAAPLVAAIQPTTGVIIPLSAGTATMTYTVAGTGGCSDATATRVLTVSPQSSAGTLTGTQSICSGSSTTFSSTVSGGTWTTTNSSIANVSTAGVVTGGTAGTATITYTVAGTGGCSDATAQLAVTVTALPNAGTITGTSALCVGSVTTLSSTASGGTWTTTSSSIAPISSAGVVTGTAVPMVIFSENMGAGVSSPFPDVNAYSGWQNAGALVFSDGQQAAPADVRTTNPSAGYTSASGGGNVFFTSASSTNAGGFSIEGINASSFRTMTLDFAYRKESTTAFPSFSVDYWNGTGWVNLANTSAALFNEAATAAAGWYPAKTISLPAAAQINGLKIRFVRNTNVNVAIRIDDVVLSGTPTAGTATITYTVNGTGGCSNAISNFVITVTAPPISGTITGTSALCIGSVTTLTSTASGGTWTTTSSSIAPVSSAGVVTGTAAGTATITYTVNGTGGCSNASSTFVVNVTAPPIAGTITGTSALCVGSVTTLSSTVSGGTWTTTSSSIAPVTSAGVVTGTAAGTATITYTVVGTGGCANVSTSRLVTVTAPPISGTITGTSALCIGSVTTLTSTASGGTWTITSSSIAPVSSAGVVTGTAAGTATITYTVNGTGGCSNASSTFVITVTAPPTAGAITGTTALCVGSSAILTSSVSGGTWSTTDASKVSISSGGVILGVSAGTATITYTVVGTGGCANVSTSRLVTVTARPNAGTITGTSALCVGSVTTLTSSANGGTWATTSTSIAPVSNAGVVTGTAAGTATITYTVIGTGGCSNASTNFVITVTARPSAGTITGTSALCVGSSATLTSSVSGGTWSTTDASKVSISSTGVILGVAAGTATITYTVAGSGGCSDAIAQVAVTVTAPPIAGALSGTQAICVGGNSQFTSTATGGSWSTDDALIATVNSSTGQVTGVGAGSVTITYTVAGTGGCANATNTRIVVVTAPPSAGLLTGTQAICQNANVTFSSTASGGTWSAANSAIISVNAVTGVVTGLTAGTTNVIYTVAGSGGCANATASSLIIVTALPNAGTITGNGNICVGGISNFSSSVSGGTWSLSNPVVASVNTSGSVVGLSAGFTVLTYTILGTGGCADANAVRTVTVTAPPQAGVLSGTQAICVGGTTNFTSTTAGGAWSSSNTAIATVNNSSGAVVGISAGTAVITYTLTGTGGCANVTSQRTVTVSAPPNAGTLSGNQNICQGGSSLFSSTILGGTWASASPAVATVSTSGLVSGVGPGTSVITYSIPGTGGCNNATATSVVSITAPPNAGTLSGTQLICVGATSNFTTTGNGGSWTSTNPSIASVSANGLVTGLTAGTVSIVYTVPGTGGCATATVSRSVTVSAPPSAGTLSATSSLCVGASVTFSSTVAGGSWSSSDPSIVLANVNSGLIVGVATGPALITYTVAGNGGCADATATQAVQVNPVPTANFSVNNATQCLSTNQFLFTNQTSISSGTLSYTWDFGDNSAGSTATSPVYTYLTQGSYTVTLLATSAAGCRSSFTRNVTVAPMPTGTLNPVASNLLCEGGSVNLSASGGASYQWLLNGGAIPGAVNATLSATQPGLYSVNVINSFGCSATAAGSVLLELVRKPVANFSFFKTCAGFETSFQNLSDVSSNDVVNYIWSFGQGQGTSTQPNPLYIFTAAGSYVVSLSVVSQLCPSAVSTITKPVTIIAPPANQRYAPVNAVENRDLALTSRTYGGATYAWSPATGLNSSQIAAPIFNYNAQVEYVITITTSLGCVLKDTQLVRVFKEREIYVPKGFSPNRDNKNDKLIPRLVGITELLYFKVYNRWGQLLFSTGIIGEGWDGTYRGAKQPMDTYVWMAEGKDLDGNIIKRAGNFILLH